MDHKAEGVLQSYLDGELREPERAAVASHVAACAECAATLSFLREAAATLHGALIAADPAPVDAGAAWAQLDAAPGRATAPAFRHRAAAGRRMLQRAALFVLGFGAVASAAIPGSPVRAWVAELLEPAPPAPTPDAAVPAPAAPADVMTGVEVPLRDGEIRVELDGLAPDTRVRVRLVEGSLVTLRATAGMVDARFETGAGRLRVEGGGVGELELGLPLDAARALVAVDGSPYLEKSGQGLALRGAGPDESARAEVVFQVGR